MSPGFALSLAWREARSSARRIGLYMGAIALGVAALVAIDSFRAGVIRSVRAEAQALLGADLRLESGSPFTPEVRAILDAAAAAGTPVASVTRLGSMVLAPATGRTRLLQVRAVEGGYPFYGDVVTEPAGLWPLDPTARRALVDPAVLVQLGVAVGDTIAVGDARFTIAGTVVDLSGDVGIQAAIGPRVYIPATFLGETGLVRLGSLVRYQAYLRLDGAGGTEAFLERHEATLREGLIDIDTAEEQVENLTERLGSLTRFLGLVGLMAVLLGGIGVASAVHVFVREKLTAIAVLRCLGATRRSVFLAYLLQTGALGLGGAAVGAIAGLAVQALLPGLLDEFLPVDVAFTVHLPSILAGLAVGAGVATLFALLPLLAVRDVAPLQALRRDVEPEPRRRDPARILALAALGAGVLALGIAQAPRPAAGIAFAAGIAAALLLLWATAWALVHATRRLVPRRAGYVLRQGIANLFRPRNQTVAVTLSLGFGVFLLATLWLTQRNLIDAFRVDAAEDRPNLLLFDIQSDQRDGVLDFARGRDVALREITPIVPARIAALNGRPAAEIVADTTPGGPSGWALRREYRNTYRDTVADSERVIAGAWWDAPTDGLPRISVEADLAEELHIGIGDRITWDVQGVPIETVVASLRRVDWARFAPNFFVVFEPGVLEAAPQTLIALAHVPDATARAELQRDLVERFPNVSILDLALVQEAVDGVLGNVVAAIRFLALFSIASGLVVLVGALSASRFQRLREVALLRTLGASSRQIRRILLTEYLALGSLAGLTGVLLAIFAAWPIVSILFELEFRVPVLPLAAACVSVAVLTAAVGVLHGRDAARRSPLAVLRDAGE
jgi:putative ABC transport system permease protein